MTQITMHRRSGLNAALLAVLLTGCVAPGPVVVKDGGPDRDLEVDHIPDPVPRHEPRTRAGNSNPYTVLGKTYHLVEDTQGFRQTGLASWYGTKFHGMPTANGEIYDMYGMTAAHKTLPIPSYVRVTNKNNGRSVIVRINDRGPFHDGRIIDLTYTAAKKLGFHAQGTAPVELEYLDAGGAQVQMAEAATGSNRTMTDASAPAPLNSGGYALPDNVFLQAGAFSSEQAAHKLRDQLREITDYPVVIKRAPLDKLVRVQIGPFKDNLDLMNLRQELLDAKFSEPHVVYE